MADDEELFACPCKRYVEFAVDGDTVSIDRRREDVQQVRLVDGCTVYDDVPLTSLIALYGVDGNLFSAGNFQFGQLVGYQGYLVAERYNDTDSSCGIEFHPVLFAQAADGTDKARSHGRLVAIGLVRPVFRWQWGVYKTEARSGYQPLIGVSSCVFSPFEIFLLMLYGDGFQFAGIEMQVYKVADGRMHASLTVQHGLYAFCRVQSLLFGQALEK